MILFALAALSAGQARSFVLTNQNPSPILAKKATSCDNLSDCRTLWQIVWSCLFTLFCAPGFPYIPTFQVHTNDG